jgi:drug/metabolite transporter (DMT)-like permease
MRRESFEITAGYVFICFLWGSTWLAIRIGLEALTPFVAAGFRFLIASFFIWMIMRFWGIRLQTDSEALRIYVILGIFSFVIPFGLVYWAEQFIPSGLASILFATFPFFVIIFSKLMMKGERVGMGKILGAVTGFFGIYLIYSENLNLKLDSYVLGMTAVLLSAAIQGWIAVLIKIKGKKLHPLSMNLVPLVIAGIVLVLLGFAVEDTARISLNWKAVSSVLYLAFFGTVGAFTVYYWLMKRINVIILSLSSFITPIIALILGNIILDESFSERIIWGSTLVLTGILFANFSGLKSYLVRIANSAKM